MPKGSFGYGVDGQQVDNASSATYLWALILGAIQSAFGVGGTAATPNGSSGGVIIADTSLHAGPFSILKAQGGDAVIATGTLPSGWTGSLNGLTISNGDTLIISGMSAITLTSGTVIAYT